MARRGETCRVRKVVGTEQTGRRVLPDGSEVRWGRIYLDCGHFEVRRVDPPPARVRCGACEGSPLLGSGSVIGKA